MLARNVGSLVPLLRQQSIEEIDVGKVIVEANLAGMVQVLCCTVALSVSPPFIVPGLA